MCVGLESRQSPDVRRGGAPSASLNSPKEGYGTDPRDRLPSTASEAVSFQRFSMKNEAASPFSQRREFSSQRNLTGRKRPSPVSDEELSGVKISRQEGHSTFVEQRRPLPPHVSSKGYGTCGDSTNISQSSSYSDQSPVQEEQLRTRRQKQPTDFISLSSPSHDQTQVKKQSVEEFSLAQLRKNLLDVISRFPDGIPITKLRKKYQELFGHKLKLKDYKLKSVNELFTVIEDYVDVDCCGEDGEDILLKCKHKRSGSSRASSDGTARSEHFSASVRGAADFEHSHASAADWTKTQTELLKDFKMEATHRDVLDLFALYPDGFPLKQLASIFNQRYRKNLTVSHYGFKSVQHLVESMSDVICIENGIMRPIGKHSGARESAPQRRTTSMSSPILQQIGIKGNSEVPLQQYGSQNPVNSNAWGISGNVTPVHPSTRGAAAPSFISFDTPSSSMHSEDFPELGTKLTKWQEIKLKEQIALERHTSSLKNDYHAQIRDVHTSNMQELDGLNWNDSSAVNQKLSIAKVNQLAEDFIRAISVERELVTVEKVVARICRHLRVQSLEQFRIRPRDNLAAVADLIRTQKEVNIFLESFEAVRTVCTLHELGQCLAALKNKKGFEELCLGPICKQPLVHKMFKVPSTLRDEDIVQIDTVDILKSLRSHMRKIGPRSKVDLAEFMKFLAEQYNCESPYELGIRIQSIALSISTVRKVANSEFAALDKAKARIQIEIEEEVENRMYKIKKSLLDCASGPNLYSNHGSYELRRQYSSMTATEAVFQVCRNAQDVFSGKLQKTIQDFLGKVQIDRLARSLFQLAICCGSLEVPNDLVAKESPPSKPSPPDKESDTGVQPPSEGALKEYLLKQLQSFSGFLTLAFLSRCEKKIVEHFKFKAFANMGLGTFLEYLVKHSQCLQEVGGGSFFLTAQDAKVCGFRASQQDVCDLIRQCGALDQSKFQAVESALKSHFRVRDVRDLGYGSLSSLVNLVQKQNKLTIDHVSQKNIVVYEASLFVKDASFGSMKIAVGPTHSDAKNYVGLLGELSKDQALACLLNAPLLENLAEWSQWELVFEPLHGPLKEFVEKNCRREMMDMGSESFAVDLVALEVSPGVLLRLTTKTSPEHFAEAAKSCDSAATAGHLVSIIVGDGLTSAPMALLANHLETALATLDVPEVFSTAETGATSRCAKFILDCLVKIPTRLCAAVMQQVFLEPFSRVVGQAISRELLLQASKSCARYRNSLHVLGIQLGITEWVKDFHMELEPPKHLTVKPEVKKHKAADETSASASSITVISEEEVEEYEVSEEEYVVSSENESEDEVFTVSSDEDDEEEVKFVLAAEVGDLSQPIIKTEKVEEELVAETKPEEVQKSTAEPAAEPELSDTCSLKESVYRAVVEKIRKEEFGVGVHLNEEGQKLMDVHQSRLGRSLERLSKELYSKDTHFVLELIQNADDNRYPENEEVTPALVFVVEKTTVYLLNNECGFEEENIKAICDIGRSTKGRHVYGYIGQKGIGFKSVFKVTDCPAIHSNGFHVYFDKNSGPLGYILPHWLDDEVSVDLSGTGLEKGSWTTKIILPLKSESYQTRNLFHDVHPSLLLFLHRLRSITVVDKVEGKVLSMVRKDLSNNILEVQYGDKADRWLVVKKTLIARNIKENVESTELALAFKTKVEGHSLGLKVLPEKQPVFAFLPLRSFGFRFIVQGDFDIPSSREDVDRDSPWNQWLRSEIPQLFLQAMETFTAHPDFKGLEGVCQFLNFVPLPDEILDFFKPVAGQIIQLLKSKQILPTKKDKDGSIEYRLPSQTAVPYDHLMQEVITSEMLSKHLNLSYLHPVVQSSVPSTLLAVLGVHTLSSSDIIAVTKAVAKELEQASSKCNATCLKNIAKLLVCCYRSLEQEYNMSDHILEELKLVPIIPLADGRILSVKGQAVFFPLDESQSTKKGLTELYKDLNIVHPSMLECLGPLQNSQVRDLLKKLDVHQLEPEKLIFEHIRPVLLNEVWKVKTPDTVKSYAVFLKLHCRQEELLKFKSYLPVFTNKDFVIPSVNKVHFTKDYKNIDLPSRLPGVDWVLLDSCYVNFDHDVDGWRHFFSVFGVEDFIILRKEKLTFTKKDLESSPWASMSLFWPSTADDCYIIEDEVCEEFYSLITADSLSDRDKHAQREVLLKMLDQNWNTGCKFSQHLTANVCDSQGLKLKDIPSSFAMHIKECSWVPATPPFASKGTDLIFLRPNEVHLRSKALFRLLGPHVSYVSVELSKHNEFAVSAGIQISVNVEVLMKYFKSWCIKKSEHSVSSEVEGAEFRTSPEHIHAVYMYFFENCSPNQLKECFLNIPAIFVPDVWKEFACSGKFFYLKEVCWNDPTGMFRRYKQFVREEGNVQEPHLLAPFYSQWDDIKPLFLQQLNIEKIPTMKQYVELLELMCDKTPLISMEILKDVSVIYAVLAKKCKIRGEHEFEIDENYCSTLKGMLIGKQVFPTKDSHWVSLEKKPLIPDNKHLEKIFKSHGICLLQLPPVDPSSRQKLPSKKGERETLSQFREEDRTLFLEICGIQKLSSCIRFEAQTEHYKPCPVLQNFVRSIVPFIQRFLYHHEGFGATYDELKDMGIKETLTKLSFGQVGKLYIQYQMDFDKKTIYEKEDVVCHLKGNKEFYIQKDHINSRTDVCRETVKLFSLGNVDLGKELDHFLQGLLPVMEDKAALERFLNQEDIKQLPEIEDKWEVPLAIIQEPKVMHLEEFAVRTQEKIEAPGSTEKSGDGEKSLASWPPKSSFGGGTAKPSNSATENVMRMWPPPAPPSESRSDAGLSGSYGIFGTSSGRSDPSTFNTSSVRNEPTMSGTPSGRSESGTPAYGNQSLRGIPSMPPLHAGQHEPHSSQRSGPSAVGPTEYQQHPYLDQTTASQRMPPSRNESLHQPPLQGHGPVQDGSMHHERSESEDQVTGRKRAPSDVEAEAAATCTPNPVFQGIADTSRPPLALDFPIWTKKALHENVLEELDLHSSVEKPVNNEFRDNELESDAVGEWGEHLVYAFLVHWKESGNHPKPLDIIWSNREGLSGMPYDFKVVFPSEEGNTVEIFIEVKATVKAEKHFITLSANEVDFALKVKEQYHLYRVYNAGDSKNVRLCRIKNLAQCLHSKQLTMYLFI